jgi:phage FluMu protein Com
MGEFLKDRPWLTELANSGDTIGECANCGGIIKAYQSTLDDAYGVIRLVCPKCKAVNLLNPQKNAWRGYTNSEMFLTLPTDHEIVMNNWEKNIPTIPCQCKKCKDDQPT